MACNAFVVGERFYGYSTIGCFLSGGFCCGVDFIGFDFHCVEVLAGCQIVVGRRVIFSFVGF